ncbi:type II 3-dehydroquinate dehydratase [Actinomadura viridis]|uniref:type II 3-dehydroquinate dehydratase n=1 Tax=Actinomadura viridis TaxID=58110 RepID=UPI0036AE8265
MADAGEVLLLNGPNLGRLGTRRPEVYGTTTLPEIVDDLAALLAGHGLGLRAVQDECEGHLIKEVHAAADGGCAGAIVNPGALMMNGWGLHDALEDFPPPWIEVHISNLWAREPFRHTSVLSPLADGVICGLGVEGYRLAALALARKAGRA